MNAVLREIAVFMANRDTRAPFDPLQVRAGLLPYFYVLEVGHDAAGRIRLRVRLTGTALDRAFGRPLRGQFMEDFLHGPRSHDVLRGFHTCARDRVPLWMRQVVAIHDRLPRYVEGVAFFVEPDRIYGGLIMGEVANPIDHPGFESRLL